MSQIIISRCETCWVVYVITKNKAKCPLIHKIFYYVLYCTPLSLFWLSLEPCWLVRNYGKALFLQVQNTGESSIIVISQTLPCSRPAHALLRSAANQFYAMCPQINLGTRQKNLSLVPGPTGLHISLRTKPGNEARVAHEHQKCVREMVPLHVSSKMRETNGTAACECEFDVKCVCLMRNA